jgi:hypothetical protein
MDAIDRQAKTAMGRQVRSELKLDREVRKHAIESNMELERGEREREIRERERGAMNIQSSDQAAEDRLKLRDLDFQPRVAHLQSTLAAITNNARREVGGVQTDSSRFSIADGLSSCTYMEVEERVKEGGGCSELVDSSQTAIRKCNGRISPGSDDNKGGKTNVDEESIRLAVSLPPVTNYALSLEHIGNGHKRDFVSISKSKKAFTTTKCMWTKEEDERLVKLVSRFGVKSWSKKTVHLPGRSGKQIRERWHNQLDPAINKEKWTPAEDTLLVEAHARLGSRWSALARLLPGRGENHIKNRWNSTLCGRLSAGVLRQQECRILESGGSVTYVDAEDKDSSSKSEPMSAKRRKVSVRATPSLCSTPVCDELRRPRSTIHFHLNAIQRWVLLDDFPCEEVGQEGQALQAAVDKAQWMPTSHVKTKTARVAELIKELQLADKAYRGAVDDFDPQKDQVLC